MSRWSHHFKIKTKSSIWEGLWCKITTISQETNRKTVQLFTDITCKIEDLELGNNIFWNILCDLTASFNGVAQHSGDWVVQTLLCHQSALSKIFCLLQKHSDSISAFEKVKSLCAASFQRFLQTSKKARSDRQTVFIWNFSNDEN